MSILLVIAIGLAIGFYLPTTKEQVCNEPAPVKKRGRGRPRKEK